MKHEAPREGEEGRRQKAESRKQKAGDEGTRNTRQKAESRKQKAGDEGTRNTRRKAESRKQKAVGGKGMRGYRDLKVYQLAYKLAMEIFDESKGFPKEERYSLTDQIRRSSRSVAANIAEGFRKRQYPNMFVSKLADADAEATETQVWLDFALDCGYLRKERHDEFVIRYEEVGRMLGGMMAEPEKFKKAESRRQ
jgi:four helix bundle protein